MRRLSDFARRPALAMAAGTAASRATGFARTVALAAALGVTAVGDAYNVANTVPNMVFQLAAGGVLSSTLVPILIRARDEQRRETASAVLATVLLVGVIGATTLAIVAPGVTSLMLPDAEAEVRRLSASWLRIFAAQVVLYAVSVACVGMLTARRRLGVAAFAPVATNVIVIAGAIGFVGMAGARPTVARTPDSAVTLIGWATTAGVAAMAAIQVWGAWRAEGGLTFVAPWRHPTVRTVLRLGRWVALYVMVNQLGLAIVIALASSVTGGVSAYQWAFVVMQLPYAIVGVSLISAAYPKLAEDAAAGRDATAAVARTISSSAPILLPAALGLAVVAGPAATALVGPRGDELVAGALVGFSVSLPAFALFQLLTRTSYAFEDTRTPALVNIVVNGVNVAWDVAVVLAVDDPVVRLVGLGLGHAASYVAGDAILLGRLRAAGRLDVGALTSGWPRRALGAAVAAGCAAGVVCIAAPAAASQAGASAITAAAVAAGGAASLLVLFVLPRARLRGKYDSP